MNIRKNLLATKKLTLSVIVPVYNEAANIAIFIAALIKTLTDMTPHYEIIIVDDGSKDDTANQLTAFYDNPHIKWISFSRNFGKEAALTAGLAHSQGDATLLIDGDFQHPLELIQTFVDHWSEGYDIVYGAQQERQSQRYLVKQASRFFYKIMQKISNVKIPPNAGDFRLLDKRAVAELNRLDERERFMKGLYAWIGFSSKAVPFVDQVRVHGKSNWGIRKLIELALVGITSFSSAPLRFSSYMGMLVSLGAFIYGICIIVNTLFFGDPVKGYPTLIAVILFLGGVQLLSIGIVGEYIARIFNEVKRRPTYIIAQKKGFDDAKL